MQVRRRNDVQLAWFPAQLTPDELSGIFVVKATFTISKEGQLEPAEEPEPASGDRESEDGVGISYPSDFAPFKPAADVTLRAHAHAPGGSPVPHLPVELRVGQLVKRLAVIGDREWQGGILGRTPGDPKPFTSMPITWERAAGDPKDGSNPVGVGRTAGPMPNIEWPDRLMRTPGDRVVPAGFAPIAATWEPRVSCRGTYRGNYLETRWPWFPEDLEWSYFSNAPVDQRVANYLRGDEELALENLHRNHSKLTLQLPGQRARCFVTFADNEFREVELVLDTLHVDLEEDRCIVAWRGRTPIHSLRMREVTGVLGLLEPLGTSNPLAHYEAIRDAAPAEELEDAERDAEFAATFKQMDANVAAAEDRSAQIEAEVDELTQQIEQEMNSQQDWLLDHGISPEIASPPDAPKTPDAAAAAFNEALERVRGDSPDLLPPDLQPLEVAEFQLPEDTDEPDAAEPETDDSWTRPRVEQALADQTPLAGTDLSGLDLHELDFSGMDLTAAVLAESDLTGARLTGAILEDADLTGATVVGVALQGATIEHATFDGLDLAGLDLSNTRGVGASFAGCNLAGCGFAGSDLPKTDFSECDLSDASFRGATLTGARFGETKAHRIDCTDARLDSLHGGDESDFSEAVFRRANLEGANLSGARLDGADLAYANLHRALLTEASATKAELSRANLAHAVLDDADLTGAKLLQSNLLYCSLERVNFTDADLREANLYGSGTWQANTAGANLAGANLQATRLS